MASSFSVNGSPFPIEPKSASVSYQDLDGESERNANGILVRQVIRRNVVKVELEFGVIDSNKAQLILAMLDSPSFYFTYPDPKTGLDNTIQAYCGDRQLGFLRTNVEGFPTFGAATGEHLYSSLTVSIIEY